MGCVGSLLTSLALFVLRSSLYGDLWSLGLPSTSPEQVTKAALARLSYTSAVRLVSPLLSARDHAGAGRRSLTSYNVLGSQPAQNKGLFGLVALTGQRALLAHYRSHTLSDFRFCAPLFALGTLLRLLLSHGNTLFPVTDPVRPLYSTRISTIDHCIRCSLSLLSNSLAVH